MSLPKAFLDGWVVAPHGRGLPEEGLSLEYGAAVIRRGLFILQGRETLGTAPLFARSSLC